jgi:hypothetical protein
MEVEKIIETIISNAKGLTNDEISKCRSEYDPIYLNDRITHHRKISNRQNITLFLLVLFAILAFVVVVFGTHVESGTMSWIRGVATGYFVAILFLMPKTFKNHASIAGTLSLIKMLREEGKKK